MSKDEHRIFVANSDCAKPPWNVLGRFQNAGGRWIPMKPCPQKTLTYRITTWKVQTSNYLLAQHFSSLGILNNVSADQVICKRLSLPLLDRYNKMIYRWQYLFTWAYIFLFVGVGMNSLLTCIWYDIIAGNSEESIVFQVFTGDKIKLKLTQWYYEDTAVGAGRFIALRYYDDGGDFLGSCLFLKGFYPHNTVGTLSLGILIDSFQFSHEYRLWIQNKLWLFKPLRKSVFKKSHLRLTFKSMRKSKTSKVAVLNIYIWRLLLPYRADLAYRGNKTRTSLGLWGKVHD